MYRYIDVLPKFIKAYNDIVHSATVMALSIVTDSDILAIWKRLEEKRRRISAVRARSLVGQHVRICKETFKFAKGAEQKSSSEIFRVAKVIESRPRSAYEVIRENSIRGSTRLASKCTIIIRSNFT